MGKRKITCNNSSCKHHTNGGCDTCITLDGSGKCKSFEKGFAYYFHIVWDALDNKNFIDMVEIRMNPDLKTGLFYVMECYDLGFSEMEWGTCRMVMLKDGKEGKPLKYEEIIEREMNMERLIPIGKDGLMLNIDGKNYVENHQYSKKVKTMTWKDERYTDAESLKEDAEAKLDELSKPYRSYTAEIINLVEAVQDEEKKEQYKEVFSIALGDTVLLISKSTGIRESHRIVKFYEYPLTKEKNKVELANTRLSFEEVQRTEQELS